MSIIDNYNQIVGSGGFGLVLKNDKDQVIKLLYSGSCGDAKKEFEKNDIIYKTFLSTEYQLVVPKPLIFNMEQIQRNNIKYSCFYIMTYLHPILLPDQAPVLYHIINNEYEPIFNKIVGKVYSMPVTDKNPPRGFFASYNYIQTILNRLPNEFKGTLMTINDILEVMGYVFGTIIFGAGYKPIDVEYVLCEMNSRLAIGILDFGMVEPIDWNLPVDVIGNDIIDNVVDIDLYLPTPGTPEMKIFLRGFDRVKIGEDKKELFNFLRKNLD